MFVAKFYIIKLLLLPDIIFNVPSGHYCEMMRPMLQNISNTGSVVAASDCLATGDRLQRSGVYSECKWANVTGAGGQQPGHGV